MQTLLRIDSSLREEGSYSRMYGDIFIRMWKENYPDSEIHYRDVNKTKIPHLTQEVTDAFFGNTKNVEQLKTSTKLCKEIKKSDVLLFTCPMYNFGIPSTLKTYFDHIVRVNETFQYDDSMGYKGLLRNKKAYLITSMGDKKVKPEVPELFEQYLYKILNFMGINVIKMISIDGTGSKDLISKQKPYYINQIKQII